jgi:ubiquinone/menaquinone biosynthesis C-methylase UbiE
MNTYTSQNLTPSHNNNAINWKVLARLFILGGLVQLIPHNDTMPAPELLKEFEKRQRFDPVDIWEKLGITEHLGGIDATRRLIERCRISPGSYALDIGCGTGYTACLLAKHYGLRVVAADISERVLRRARERIERESLSEQVTIVPADIHALNFAPETFDAVIAESVLVFCDQPLAAAEVYRVLKPGGVFGDNELTFLKPPEWKTLLSSAYFGLDIQPLLGEAWRSVFEQAEFANISSEVSRLSLREQLVSHIRVDGWRKYLMAVVRGLALPGVRATFLNRDMLRAWRKYPTYVGYGLYVSEKR